MKFPEADLLSGNIKRSTASDVSATTAATSAVDENTIPGSPPLSDLAPVTKPHRSIGVMVAASLISAGCGIILTFVVPGFLSVDDFGVWRTFLLFAGYAGLLHLGLTDGALLLWSKSPRSRWAANALLQRALLFIAVEHLGLLAIAVCFRLLKEPRALPALMVALGIYCFLFNLVGLLQVYFQTGLRFTPVAFGMCAPNALFVVSLCVLAFTHVTVNSLLIAYLSAWAVTLLSLLWLARSSAAGSPNVGESRQGANPPFLSSSWRFGLNYIATGWPIVLTNSGFGLMQSADRVTVNLTRPLHDFAIYSLSQSTIYVPITLLAAVSRVVFSWFARARGEDRTSLYRRSTRLLGLIWMLLLPYYFLVEFVVRSYLPRYIQGLASGRILLLSVLFLSLIQIVQMNTYNLEGNQRQFFAGSLAAVAVAFATAWFGAVRLGSLSAVAWSQVLTAALWWLGNEWFLRRKKLMQARDILAVFATFALSTASLYAASIGSLSRAWGPAVYYGLIAIPAFFLYRKEIQDFWIIALQSRPVFRQQP